MLLSNERAIEILDEIRREDFSNFGEFRSSCNEQLNIAIRKNGYSFFSDWEEEDFKSEVIEKIWRDLEKYDPDRGCFSTWLELIGRTIYYKHYNNEKKRIKTQPMIVANEEGKEINILDEISSSAGAESELIANETVKEIYDNLNSLSANQQRAIYLCRIEGYKPSEAAEIIGCRPADISRWINRGVDKLKRRFKDNLEVA